MFRVYVCVLLCCCQEEGYFGLDLAAHQGHVDIARIFVNAGAGINDKDDVCLQLPHLHIYIYIYVYMHTYTVYDIISHVFYFSICQNVTD